MHALLLAAGVLVLVAVDIDIIWSTIGAHGGGPFTRPLQRAVWSLALRLHRRLGRRHHFALSFVGPLILVGTITFWTCGNGLGLVMMFRSDPSSIIDAQTRAPADLGSCIYFVAYTLSSMGNGDFVPSTTVWRLVTSFATLSGIAALTLGVSFILSVLTAVVERRTLGALISDLGGTPERILRISWHEGSFTDLHEQLNQLTSMVELFIEQHLAYPTVQFFHSETSRTAAPLRVFALHETMLLLAHGSAEPVRLAPLRTEPLLNAFRALAQVFEEEHTTGPMRDDAPPPPELAILREIRVPTVSDAEFADAIARVNETRSALHSILLNDGWSRDEAIRGRPPAR
jgi:hypothetical protein